MNYRAEPIRNLADEGGRLNEAGFPSHDIAANPAESGTEQTIHGLAGWPQPWSL